MANPVFGHPEPFKPTSSWTSYQERLELFFEANKMEDENLKRAVFLTVVGEETYEIIRSLATPKNPKEVKYGDLLKLLSNHFNPKPNEIVQRYRFYKRMQKQGESIAEYITELRRLSEHCNFGELEKMLRDQIVCGVLDESLQRRLFSEPDLSYKKATELALSSEAASRDVRKVRGDLSSGNQILHVQSAKQNNKPRASGHSNVTSANSFNNKKCFRCAGTHSADSCKFKNASCNFCKKSGHIADACFKKKFVQKNGEKECNVIEQNRESVGTNVNEMHELNVVQNIRANFDKFMVSISINQVNIEMEVDSGAALSIIPSEVWYGKIGSDQKLNPSGLYLQTYSKQKLNVLGECDVMVRYHNKDVILPIVVVKGSGSSLIGRNWFQKLGFDIQGIHSVDSSAQLLCEKYSKVFSGELGAFTGPPVTVDLIPDAKPVFFKARQVPFAIKPAVETTINELVSQGVLRPVQNSRWATPVVCVRKKDGAIRLCGDYRSTVNPVVKRNSYPLPTNNEIMAAVNGATLFSKLDLMQGYQQLPVDDESSEILTINTHKGLYNVRRLAFGVNSASGICQRVMETMLGNIGGVVVFQDDILVTGSSVREHNTRLEEVLKRLNDNNMTVRKDKCVIATNSIEFVGFKISAHGIQPTDDKIKAIKNAPEPKNREELQSFLGLLNFYNRFLKNKATKAEDMFRLLDVNNEWKWTVTHSKKFQELKELLQSDTVLAHYSPTKELVLSCDASSYGIGAVLSHRNADNSEQPIAYASRTMGKSERNYSQLDKEALSIIFGMKHFHQYVAGRRVTIITDHKPLLGILQPNKQIPVMLSPRLLRWCLQLSGYEYVLQYRPGKEHGNADFFSRLPQPSSDDVLQTPGDILLFEAFEMPRVRAEHVHRETQKDPTLCLVSRWLHHGWPESKVDQKFDAFISRRNELSLHKNCILWGSRTVIPESLRSGVLKLLHANHPGMTAMKALARSYVWWPKLDSDIESTVRSCKTCQLHQKNPAAAPLQTLEKPSNPWSTLHLDFAGPWRGKNFLIVVDSMSKWLEVVLVSNQSSAEVIRSLRVLFATHGIPDRIISDNGTAFVSEEIRQFYSSNGIEFRTVAPYHPSSNGQAERMVQTTKDALSKIDGDWNLKLARFLFRQHTTPHASTGKTPAELLMNRRLQSCLDKLHPDNLKDKTANDIPQSKGSRSFEIGDDVLVRNYTSGPKWLEAKVIDSSGAVSYIVELKNGQIARRHINQIVPKHYVDIAQENEDDLPELHITIHPEEFVRQDPEPEENPANTEENSSIEQHNASMLQASSSNSTSLARQSGRIRTRPAYLDDYVGTILAEEDMLHPVHTNK